MELLKVNDNMTTRILLVGKTEENIIHDGSLDVEVGRSYHLDMGLTTTIEGQNDDGTYWGSLQELQCTMNWEKSGKQVDGLTDYDLVEEYAPKIREEMVLVSLLQILPHLPVTHYNRDMTRRELITHVTIHNNKEMWIGECVAFHTESEEKRKPWWIAGNSRNALGGCVDLIPKYEADRLGIKYTANPQFPEYVYDSIREDTQGDMRPAARKSVQTILYGTLE